MVIWDRNPLAKCLDVPGNHSAYSGVFASCLLLRCRFFNTQTPFAVPAVVCSTPEFPGQ